MTTPGRVAIVCTALVLAACGDDAASGGKECDDSRAAAGVPSDIALGHATKRLEQKQLEQVRKWVTTPTGRKRTKVVEGVLVTRLREPVGEIAVFKSRDGKALAEGDYIAESLEDPGKLFFNRRGAAGAAQKLSECEVAVVVAGDQETVETLLSAVAGR